jgi:acyl homoserine lactone synthase
MYILLKRSGWNITEVSQGESEKNQIIYLLHLDVNIDSQQQLINKIRMTHHLEPAQLETWPIMVPDFIK